jgi:hypothetical protein
MARDRRPLALLLTVVAVYRLSLLGRGALAFVDETLYFKAAMALRALAAGHVRAAVFDLVTNNARPGDALLKTIPAAMQAIALAFGIPAMNPVSLLIPTICNVAVSLILVWLVYRLCERFTDGDGIAALTAAAAYALLASSNVYIRHLFPYDWALAVALWGIWLAVSRPMTGRGAAAIGFLAGAVVVIYPGYYPLVIVVSTAVVVADAESLRRRVSRAAFVAVGAAAPIALTEVAGRWSGFRYLASARELSGTITGGSFDEGWVFLPRYLIEVERAAGVVLLVAVAAYVVAAALDIRRTHRVAAVHWIVGAAAAGWLWQAALSSIGRRMVLYGRLIHPWMAILAIVLAFAIHAVGPRRMKAVICAAVMSASVVSWGMSAREYYRVAYPRDVLYAWSIDPSAVAADRRPCEFETTQTYDAPPRRRSGAAPGDGRPLLLINMCQGFPVPDREVAVPSSAGLLFDAPHFERYPAYQFEGYTPEQRRALNSRDYRVAVYELR